MQKTQSNSKIYLFHRIKTLMLFCLILMSSTKIFSQEQSIFFNSIDLSLGMEKSFVLDILEKSYKVQINSDMYFIFDRYDKEKWLGIVQFDEEDKLVYINKRWGDFSLTECSDIIITIYRLLAIYKDQPNIQVRTQEFIDPVLKEHKIITFWIKNKSIELDIKESNTVVINENLMLKE